MRPPEFNQPTHQNNNQNCFQGNKFNQNQNHQPNQGAIYQNQPVTAVDDVEDQSIPSPTPPTPPSQQPQDIPSTSQAQPPPPQPQSSTPAQPQGVDFPESASRSTRHLKAFRVFNSRTRIVQETLHVNFMENKPNVAGSGPAWLFDIDSLSQTMNYHPVLAENQSNPTAGFQDTEKAREEETHTYVLFPVLSNGSINPKNNKDAHTGGNEHNDDIQKSVPPSCGDQAREQGDKPVNKDKGKSPVVTITGFRDLNEEFAECINNSSNEVNAAGPLVFAAGLEFTNSTNDFTTAGPLVSAAELNYTNNTNDFSAADPSNAAMPNLEDLSHNPDDVG
nr:ribonuclease H-like domain-containing protein [Tanacetum cinerariifolium]